MDVLSIVNDYILNSYTQGVFLLILQNNHFSILYFPNFSIVQVTHEILEIYSVRHLIKSSIYILMIKTHNQKYYESLLESIKSSSYSIRVKNLLLQSLIQTLKKKNEENFEQSFSSFPSELSNDIPSDSFENEELQEKIIQKRAAKFELNDEMESTEDYLYQIEKVVETKRQYDEKLKRQIKMKIQAINQERQMSPENGKSYFDKSFGVVSDIFKGWLG